MPLKQLKDAKEEVKEKTSTINELKLQLDDTEKELQMKRNMCLELQNQDKVAKEDVVAKQNEIEEIKKEIKDKKISDNKVSELEKSNVSLSKNLQAKEELLKEKDLGNEKSENEKCELQKMYDNLLTKVSARHQRLAIIVANSEYKSKYHSNLKGVTKDVRALKKLLEDSFVVEVIRNSSNIEKDVEDVITNPPDEDKMSYQRVLFIYLVSFYLFQLVINH